MLEYILDQFSRIYAIDNVDELVGYGTSAGKKILVRDHGKAFFSHADPHPGDISWVDWNGRRIPVLFGEESEIITKNADSIVISVDVIAGAFFFLSSWQEYHDDNPDNFGRYRHSSSIQHRYGFTQLPVVNYYFDILKTAIEQATGKTLEFRHWNSYPFAAFLSHDLDKLFSGWKEGSWSELKKGRIGSPPKLVAKRFLGKDAWFNIEEIMAIEEDMGFHSTFFFLPEKGKHLGVLNADYDISSGRIQSWIKKIDHSKWEVGVHGAYGSAFEKERLTKQLDKFPSTVTTNRFHFLSWKPGESEVILENNGLSYDCSLGFAEEVGFRHGIAHPFEPYLLREKRKSKFVEIPLHIMDSTLRDPRYKGEGPGNVEKMVYPVIDEIEKFRGCLSILWHNNYLSKFKYAGWEEAYIKVLGILKERNALSVTPGDPGGFWE